MAVFEAQEVKQENTDLETIEETVFDLDKIVTYKSLSRLLNIHVNKSKRLLSTFVEEIRHRKKIISVTYLLSGKEATKDGAWRVCVVPEGKLEEARKMFSPENFSEHVYSVHQGGEVADTGALLLANKMEDGSVPSSRFSAIENTSAVPKSKDEVEAFVSKVALQKSEVPAISTKKKPAHVEIKKEPDTPVSKPDESNDVVGSKEVNVKKEVTVKKNGGTINSMFAAQNSKTSDKVVKAVSKSTTNNKDGKKTAGGNIASFFQRQINAGPKKPKPESAPVEKKSPPKEKDSAPASDSVNSHKSDTQITAPSKATQKQAAKTSKAASKTTQKSKRKNCKEKSDNLKKRKRIVALSESESSDDSEKDEAMEVDSPPPPVSQVIDSEEENTVVNSTPPSTVENGVATCREKRLVDKTYIDDKGFIVTKKEWVVETYTVNPVEVSKDNSDSSKKLPENAIKQEPVSPKEEKVAPVTTKRKQADIMSFFSRK